LWEHLADGELVERLMPAVLRALDAFERQRGDDGLLTDVTGWVFVDWAQTERGRNTAALDALYALALDDAATLSDALGDHGTAGRLRARADQTRKSFEHYWDAERGVYVDAADAAGPRRRVSQQTNSLAILSGAPEDRWPAILGYVMDERRLVFTKHPGDGAPERHRYQWMPPQEWGTGRPLDEETEVVLAQPFFCHFLHQALAAAGEHGALRSSIRRWQRLVDRGNGVFEEYWDHVPGEGSRCHAWSATPTYDLTAHVLGVRAAAPGWTDIAVRPCLGDLEWVEGGVPTPKGLVRLRLASDGSGFVELPPGVSGELLLADASLSLRSGRQEIRPA
jgi:hypothetical protein